MSGPFESYDGDVPFVANTAGDEPAATRDEPAAVEPDVADPSAESSPDAGLDALFGSGDRPTVESTDADGNGGLDDLFGDAAPAPASGGGGRLAAMRAQAEAESTFDNDELARHGEQVRYDRKMSEQERLFGYVDRVLGMIASDVELNTLAVTFELTRDPAVDRRQRAELETKCSPKMLENHIAIDNPRDNEAVYDIVYDELLGISVLGDVWRDDAVSEICIDAWDRIAVERDGELYLTGHRFRNHEHCIGVIRALSRKMSDRQVSPTNPLVTAQLPSARVQFVYGQLAASGVSVTIRKFKPLMGMDGLRDVDALSADMRAFLDACVQARSTVLVSGGTGTGKTTMINALSESIPDSERVITIEDSFELQLSNSHVVSLQAKQRASADDTATISQADLMTACLRMRPDRIVVGEIREPEAAAVMFDAANTGHDGTMTTIHADTPFAALNNRLTVLLMRSEGGFSEDIARLTVAQTVHVVVQITRTQGRRFISEIAIVDPSMLDERGLVIAQPIFQSKLKVDTSGEQPRVYVDHQQVGTIRSDTVLAAKLADSGQEVERWVQD